MPLHVQRSVVGIALAALGYFPKNSGSRFTV